MGGTADMTTRLQDALGDRYRILREIGRGGMAVVYLADDLKHSRRVALKVLDRDVGESVGAARFLREIEIAAGLSHPRIVPLLDSGTAGGDLYYVMPYVEGESLAARLAREGPLPIDEAVEIAWQVATALSYAHEREVVHRDIKPDNILLSGSEALVADFGVARALTAAGAPTLTRSGLMVGTPLYMSPEQAAGSGEADARSDIYALGLVLYEMLAGEPPFTAKTAQAVTVRKLSETAPDVRVARESTPPALAEVVRKALQRVPADRFRTADEVAGALRRVGAGAGAGAGEMAVPGASSSTRAWWRGVAVGALVATVVLVAASAFFGPAGRASVGVMVELIADGLTELAAPEVALSPDGRRLAYLADGRLWIRALDGLEPREVPDGAGARLLVWSPDGEELAFVAGGRFRRAPAAGGESVPGPELGMGMTGGSGAMWAADGHLVFATGSTPLRVVRAGGGSPRDLIPLAPGEQDHHHPSSLPGGRGILFVPHRLDGFDAVDLLVDGERRELLRLEGRNVRYPVYSPTGHILFETEGDLWAVGFSLRRLEVTGEPFRIRPGARRPSVGDDGSLAFFSGPARPSRQLHIVDRAGEVLQAVGDPGRIEFFAPSPQGTSVAMARGYRSGIWMVDRATGARHRPTGDGELATMPGWSPDGSTLAYWVSAPEADQGVRLRAADGTGSARLVSAGWGPSFTPDGQGLTVTLNSPFGTEWDIGYVDLEAGADPVRVVATRARECCPEVSPDGRYLAYASDASGQWEVYATRFPSGEGRWQVSPDGGAWPRWDHRGRRLYYVRDLDVMEVPLKTEPELRFGAPRLLFSRPARVQDIRLGLPDFFHVIDQGEAFLVLHPAEAGEDGGRAVVLRDWRRVLAP
jgi:eukaryotic-like serine/threonine-protein kinase